MLLSMLSLLPICHCEVPPYSGRSCCVEVVDRQDFRPRAMHLSVNWESSLKEPDIEHE